MSFYHEAMASVSPGILSFQEIVEEFGPNYVHRAFLLVEPKEKQGLWESSVKRLNSTEPMVICQRESKPPP